MSNLKESLQAKILSIPGVTDKFWPNENGGFTGFVYKKKEFAHFHMGNELDLRLTTKLIASENLTHHQDSVDHPKRAKSSPWIELRFNSEADVLNIYRLVNMAIEQI